MERGRVLVWTISLVLAVFAGISILIWGGPLVEFLSDEQAVGNWLADFGPWAPLASIGLNAAQVVLAPVPGHVIGLANGYLFGLVAGTFYSMAGLVAGSAVAMMIGRRFGRPIVSRLVGRKRMKKIDSLAQRRGPVFFFLIFLLPMLPDDLTCFAVGMSPLSIPFILLLAAIGRLPGMIVSSWIGANARGMSSLGWGVLTGGALLAGTLVLIYRKKLEKVLMGIAGRLSSRVEE